VRKTSFQQSRGLSGLHTGGFVKRDKGQSAPSMKNSNQRALTSTCGVLAETG